MNEKKIDKTKMRCPICSNYIYGKVKEDGSLSCSCNYCKSVVYSKDKCNGRERIIKVKFIEAT